MIVIKAAPVGTYIKFALALYVWQVAASVLGAKIADILGISDTPSDLKSDMKKMSLCTLIALSLFLVLFYFAQASAVIMLYILVFFIALKVAYLEANSGFLLTVVGTSLVGMVVFAPVAGRLRLAVILSLYLGVSAVAGINLILKRKRNIKNGETRKQKENELRDRIRRDPEFTTFCYQCRFSHPGTGDCRLKSGDETVSEITLNQKKYCTWFEPLFNPDENK